MINKSFIPITLLLLLNSINLNAQDSSKLDYKNIIKYVDSLLCNKKITHYNGYDTIVFDISNKNIYIDEVIDNCVLSSRVIKLKDSLISYDWVSKMCIGNVQLLRKEDNKIDENKERISIGFCRNIYKDPKGDHLDVWIKYFYFSEDMQYMLDRLVRIYIYIKGENIIGYKCLSYDQ